MRNLLCTILFMVFGAPVFAGGDEWRPSFETIRMDGAFWGMAAGELDGDFKILLLKRREIVIGRLNGKSFERVKSCALPGAALGARVYIHDIDGGGRGEIIVGATEDELPSSLAIKFEDEKCSVIFSRERMMLRVVEDDSGRKKLLGQGWSADSFFFGPVCEYDFEKGKLKKGMCLKIPNYVNVYQFASFPNGTLEQFAVVKGYDHLQVYEKTKRGFARVWQSGEKFGGSLNLIRASQREVMGEVTSDYAAIDVPPIVVYHGGGISLAVVRHEMPIADLTGVRPLIRGSELAAFAPDESFVFKEVSKTMRMPAVTVDALIQKNSPRILLLMQDLQGLFMKAKKSFIIGFDLPDTVQ